MELTVSYDTEKIHLLRPDGKTGQSILRRHYDLVCIFILGMLESKIEVTLTELLAAADRRLAHKFPSETSWIVLHVKQDLEARRMIKLKYVRKCTQVISLQRNHRRIERYILRIPAV